MSLDRHSRVRILSDQVVNQIAAGEVVERPASVVKELVENSLDAGADEITVAIANGGRSSVEVIDNGHGMSKADALLAIERFGTSKISVVEDLMGVSTHGFRGEALPSIASVSRFKLSTSAREQSGVFVTIDGGTIKDVVETALAPGTRVEVRHLFHNVPARRKFLRSENTETGLVKAQVIDFALAYPHVRFRLVVDGIESAVYAARKSLFDRAKELRLAGEKPLEILDAMQSAAGEIRVHALLSQPVECVSTAGRLRLLVNRRSVRDKLLLKAVREGYGNFLKPGRYPIGVLNLEIPPSEVDVNVHPQKTEVRFRRPELVFAAISRAIAKQFQEYTPVGVFGSPPITDSLAAGHGEERPGYGQFSASPLESRSLSFLFDGAESSPVTSAPASKVSLKDFRFLGQALACFLILESSDQLALVDMHAAHERVKFYQIKSQLLDGSIQSQRLLIPEKVVLPPEKASQYSQFREVLMRLGMETDEIGEGNILVRSIPALLSEISPQAIFREICALPEWSGWEKHLAHAQDAVIARLACHRSVRSGRELERPEVYELLDSLEDAESSGFCPHGRPVVKFFSRAELDTLFGRARF